MQDGSDSNTGLVRLDVWLWAARFFKTRALAKAAIENGKIEVGGQRAKPARQVRMGDTLQIVRGEETFQVEVALLSSKRGAAPVAATLYREDEDARALRELQRAQRTAERSGYHAPEHKPDKRARRLIQALGDLDAL
ncbi:RNA-binding S4 domain-containing protein [Pseudoxanthomonas gei]|uniref:Heat shock protein 15 n=1 Tax=Pseudoxanthomonas gei TaxID=1383030 RepID=A0ABX0AB45_9GAMM|nr:RNA-binding S4 domain-containing protein [Pseudoxanthomonas gei]NDK38777.1 RNA-binding S4 domain-containing protein [Pseudoxanthomonas gei]